MKKPTDWVERCIFYNIGARQATSGQMYISRCLPKELRHTEFKPRLCPFLDLEFTGDWLTVSAVLPNLVEHISGSAVTGGLRVKVKL